MKFGLTDFGGSTGFAGSARAGAAASVRTGLAAATPCTNAIVCSINWSRSRIHNFITHTPGPGGISPEVGAEINGITRGADRIGATRDRLATARVRCSVIDQRPGMLGLASLMKNGRLPG